jgi:hypothetical protein
MLQTAKAPKARVMTMSAPKPKPIFVPNFTFFMVILLLAGDAGNVPDFEAAWPRSGW